MAIESTILAENISTTSVSFTYEDIVTIISELDITIPENTDINVSYTKSNGAKIILAQIFKDGDSITFEWKTATIIGAPSTPKTITDITYT